MSLGPFDLTGGPFLILYGALFLAAIVAGFVIPRRLRPDGLPQRVADPDPLAYLAGGARRFIDALVARLLATRALVMIGKDRFGAALTVPATVSPAERSLLGLPAPIRWKEIELTLKPYAEPVERRLTASGLLMSEGERANIRFWSMLPYLMLLAFGATKWIVGDLRERPVGYLTMLLLATALFAAIRWFTIDRRTQAGHDAVRDAAERAQRLKSAPTTEEIGLAVALFGTAVLVGSGWADFHTLRSATGGDGGGGSGEGSGGCSGGGCGGCGG